MASNPLEKAFQRHSRAQLPAVPISTATSSNRLSYIQSTPSWVPPVPQSNGREASKLLRHDKTPVKTSAWVEFIRLGRLLQGNLETLICLQRDSHATLFMFKLIGDREGSDLKRVLALRHPCVVMARHVIESDVGTHAGFDYFRFTLEELLNVHMTLEEHHLRTIATAVFSAVQYLDRERLVHGNISTSTIRICGRTGKVVLSDCEQCTVRTESQTSVDLEALGLVLLTCMEPEPRRIRTADAVRVERATNRVFGLNDPERWSGCKQLVDFIDDLFSLRRHSAAKLERPHGYIDVDADPLGESQLLPLAELASLECFTMWHAAE